MQVVVHRPRARLGATQLAIAAAATLAIAIGLGVAAHTLSRALVRVDLLTPLLIGLAAGGLMAVAVRQLRISRPLLAAALAVTAAVGALAAELALDFDAARAAHREHLEEIANLRGAIGAESVAARERVVRAQMEEWTLARYAAGRIGIDDSGWLTGSPPALGRVGGVTVSVLELLVAALCGWMIAGRAASDPACPTCKRWRASRPLGEARHGAARPFVDALVRGDAGAVDHLAPPDTSERTALTLFACGAHDGGGGVLRVTDVKWTRRRRLLAARRVEDLDVDAGTIAAIEERLRD